MFFNNVVFNKLNGKIIRKIIGKIILALLFLIIFAIIFSKGVQGEEIIKDVSVKITIPSQLNLSAETNFSKFIKLTNNNDTEGENDNLSVLVELNFEEGNISQINLDEEINSLNSGKNWNITKTINSYSETGFGTLSFRVNHSYKLCAKITPLNFADDNYTNNFACQIILTYLIFNSNDIGDEILNMSENVPENMSGNTSGNPVENESGNLSGNVSGNISENISQIVSENNTTQSNSTEHIENQTNESFCSCILGIEMEKNVFIEGEKVQFKILDCSNTSAYSQTVDYWIEDRLETVKPIISTTSRTTKSYTPHIETEEKYFIIKAQVHGCNNISEKLFAVTNDDISHSPFLNIESPEEISLDSNAEIFYVALKGYKGDSAKQLISLWVQMDETGTTKKMSETTKIYINGKNVPFEFKVPIIVERENFEKSKIETFKIVAEGLDEREEKKIKIIHDEKEDTDEKKTSESENEKGDENKSKENNSNSLIESFYTRKKIFEPAILLYISISEPENKTLIIKGENSEIILANISHKNTLNFTIESEKELIIAELYEKDELIETAQLRLNLSVNEKESENKTEIKTVGYNIASYLEHFERRNISANESSNKITGNAVKIIPVQFNEKNLIFALIACLIGLVLFSRKTRGYLLRNIKEKIKKSNKSIRKNKII